jgi:hypothetical protein
VAQTKLVTSSGGPGGVQGEYFDNEELRGEPALVRTDERLDFHWGEGSYSQKGPVDHFSARWTAYFVAPTEEITNSMFPPRWSAPASMIHW